MSALARSDAAGQARTVLSVPGMHCAGCMSKVERGLATVPGVAEARVNLSSRTVFVAHSPEIDARALVASLAVIGFEAQPRRDELAPRFSAVRPLLAPLAVAFFAAMNVMTLSVSVWSGADGSTRSLFHWLSALIGVPAIAYAGQPFFRSGWKVLKHGRTNTARAPGSMRCSGTPHPARRWWKATAPCGGLRRRTWLLP